MSYRKLAVGVVLVGLLLIAMAAVSFLIYTYVGADPAERHSILVKAAIDVCVISIASLIAYFTLDRLGHLSNLSDLKRRVVSPIMEAMGELKDGVYTKVTDIPWTRLFKNSKRLHIMVQGWDGWIGEVHEELSTFLAAGGSLHVLLPALPQAQQKDSPSARNLAIAAERTGVQVEDQRQEIAGTARGLEELVSNVVGRNKARTRLTITYTERMNWFCGMYFEPHSLLISVYQHKRRGIKIPGTVVPSFVVPVNQFPVLRDWFATEWTHLTGSPPW